VSIPEHVQGDLKRIAEWLMFHNYDSYMNVYASIRSSILLRSIQGLKDMQVPLILDSYPFIIFLSYNYLIFLFNSESE